MEPKDSLQCLKERATLDSILSQTNPLHNLTMHFPKININTVLSFLLLLFLI
jgi:hypothetical protein